ncbi:c-type cytochrome biogenesis protein CcsB [Aquipuribacter hungaricus]|uniref:C-type cytochrome biogenesis protein CcsB n=1 Tax=Aquipuribacter hungaricus TaxID=545624 RepID=A0ABV7WJS5_9MICO
MDWARLSDTLVYSAIAVYALAMLAYAAEAALRGRAAVVVDQAVGVGQAVLVPAVPFRWDERSSLDSSPGPGPAAGGSRTDQRLGRVAVSLTVLAFLLHLMGLITRGLAAGRAPWGNMYEYAVAGGLAATGAYLIFLRRQPVKDLGAWIVGVVTLTLGLAVTVLYTPAGDLVPALNSYWLVIHVAAAIVSGGVFTLGAAAGLLYLLRLRLDRSHAEARTRPGEGTRSRYAAHLPAAAALEKVSHSAHVFAFPIWTFAVIAGAIWAEDSWGRYWGWDPKETWAFITWVLYAAYLHAQSTAGWRGRKATWFALAGYLAFLFNFFGVNIWLPGLHSYAGV